LNFLIDRNDFKTGNMDVERIGEGSDPYIMMAFGWMLEECG